MAYDKNTSQGFKSIGINRIRLTQPIDVGETKKAVTNFQSVIEKRLNSIMKKNEAINSLLDKSNSILISQGQMATSKKSGLHDIQKEFKKILSS